ncbi:GrpB family protein [Spirosoma radiotolerans]|uniref:GrpB family protein n=1 Tax=Spirosoma radiotolerans TaxID=1379870 RepID=A0A0E3ZU72_9BACT|nr:GrpB family protein [Spirosoma radiotolerans]AKD54354.1 hypothetical protein SD10_04940 [Spirosoma radiotolerans]
MTKTSIRIEDYSPAWPLTFQQLKSVYQRRLGNLVTDIQHVGSTSVPGLAAKPILDIDLIISNRKTLNAVIEELDQLGYDYQGNLGIIDRESFKRRSDQVPLDGSSRYWQNHHLYVCPSDSLSLKNHLVLRDYLCQNPLKAQEYGELKKRLAQENPTDIDVYVAGKTPFILAILREAGFNNASLESIAQANKTR